MMLLENPSCSSFVGLLFNNLVTLTYAKLKRGNVIVNDAAHHF